MIDRLEVELVDAQFMGEINLLADLMVAAMETPEHLEQSSIDAILGFASA